MAKTVTIRDDVFKRLENVKKKDESFSELFERLLEGRSSFRLLEKLRGRVEFSNKQKLLAEIASRREEKRFA